MAMNEEATVMQGDESMSSARAAPQLSGEAETSL
jgi:hypothetical protein